ncbi:MAG TPA: nucleoside diphosphate kinase regulator [Polyangia bacterium]|jgi:regulator of nucleoside diphosphate kinase|nr:nucleoside diphosphate kinase regulator [Polyangia bacterium]
MRTSITSGADPDIVVAATDHKRLTGLATALLDRNPDLADELLAEMERARVVAPDAVPADVVRMGSTVEFRAEDGVRRRVTLVFPVDADISAGKVSIFTPVGVALIGLSAGQSIAWWGRDGKGHRMTVLAVEPAMAMAG